MRLRDRWSRIDAEHWVYWLLATRTVVLVWLTLGTFAVGWAHGFVVATAFPAALAALSGWLTAAWRQERRWAWYAAAIVSGMGVAGDLQSVLAGRASVLTPALLVFDGLVLACLFHPDSHARVSSPPAFPGRSAREWASVEHQEPGGPGDTGEGGPARFPAGRA